MNKEIDFTKLRFVRIFDPSHIPVELVEQVRDRRFSVENFYAYQKIVCLSNTENGVVLNPLNMLYVVVNEANVVKGFLWAIISPLTQDLVINTFSMDKEYWSKGGAIALIEKKTKEIVKEAGLNKIYWITNYPKHSERYGFKRSRGVLMEYQEEKDGRPSLRNGCKTSGNCAIDDAPATGISEQHTGSDASASEPSPDELVARV